MYAIVEIAGQQFKVEKGEKIFVHRLANEEGAEVTFDQVLLIDNEGKISIGEPLVDGAFVEGKVLSHVKGDKVIVFKKKRRKGYQKSNGHRQLFSSVEILAVNETGKPKAAKAVVKESNDSEKPQVKKAEAAEAVTKEKAAKTAAPKSEAAVKATDKKPAAKKTAASKPAAKKPAAKKAEKGTTTAGATKKSSTAKKSNPAGDKSSDKESK
jgi:large subunit ribosomal protein L21